MSLKENPLSEASKIYLNDFDNNVDVSYGYQATYDFTENILTLPMVDVSGSFYRVELALLDINTLQLELNDAIIVENHGIEAIAEFLDNSLFVHEVEAASALYQLELILVETEPSIVFKVTFAKTL